MNIRVLIPSDWPMVKAIYEQGIATGNATFQTEAPSWEEWNKAHLPSCRFVIEIDDTIGAGQPCLPCLHAAFRLVLPR